MSFHVHLQSLLTTVRFIAVLVSAPVLLHLNVSLQVIIQMPLSHKALIAPIMCARIWSFRTLEDMKFE